MVQSVNDEREDSGVDMYVAIDGSVVHLSIFNDEQGATEFSTEFVMVIDKHLDEDFRGDEMQQGIVVNIQANESPIYLQTLKTSYENQPNLLPIPKLEMNSGDSVLPLLSVSVSDSPLLLRHLPIQCAKFQNMTSIYFILSTFILLGFLRFRQLFYRFRITMKSSQSVLKSIKSDSKAKSESRLDNVISELDNTERKLPYVKSKHIDDIKDCESTPLTAQSLSQSQSQSQSHVIPELKCNKIVQPVMQSELANEVKSGESTLTPGLTSASVNTEFDDDKTLLYQFLASAVVYCLLAVQRNETYPSISNIFKYNYDIDLVAFYNFLRYLVPICSAICSSGTALDEYQTAAYRNDRGDTFSFNQIFVFLNDYLNPISGMNLRVWYNKIGASIPENIQPCLNGLYRTMIGPFVFSLFFTFLFAVFRVPRSWSRNVFHLGFLWNIKSGLISLLLNQFSVILLLAFSKILIHKYFHSTRPLNIIGYDKYLWNISQILSFMESIIIAALMGSHHARYYSRSFLYGEIGCQLNLSRTIRDYSDIKSLRALHDQIVCCLGHIGD